MENRFITCQHCGTLNFEGKRSCSRCDFRLPVNDNNSTSKKYRFWNYTFITVLLITLGSIFLLAFTFHLVKK